MIKNGCQEDMWSDVCKMRLDYVLDDIVMIFGAMYSICKGVILICLQLYKHHCVDGQHDTLCLCK